MNNLSHRIAGLRRVMQESEPVRDASHDAPTGGPVAAFVVTDMENIRYLTGFTGSNALLLVTQNDAVFFTDSRYALQSAREVADWERVVLPPGSDLAASAGERLQQWNAQRVGFEAQQLSYAAFIALRGALTAGTTLVPRAEAVESLRRIKDVSEIALLRAAIEIADECFETVCLQAKAGQTERALAWSMEAFMRHDRGAERLAFDTIVASGPNSANIHGRASDRVLGASGQPELLLIDFGCQKQGYNSDLTRTVVIGGPATSAQHDLYNAVAHAQTLTLAAIRPGVIGRDVDKIARDALAAAGYGEAFAHSLGHGLGRSVHDHRALGPTSDLALAPGMVLTVEPGAYLENFGGVRIEDVVLVTDDGCEVLTRAPKGLLEIG